MGLIKQTKSEKNFLIAKDALEYYEKAVKDYSQIGNAMSQPVMIQNIDNKNLELVVTEAGGNLRHYFFDYGGGSNTWNSVASRFGNNVSSAPVMFQNFYNRNFELVVREIEGGIGGRTAARMDT